MQRQAQTCMKTKAHRHRHRHMHTQSRAQKCMHTKSTPAPMHTPGSTHARTVTYLIAISHSGGLQAEAPPWKEEVTGDEMRQGTKAKWAHGSR